MNCSNAYDINSSPSVNRWGNQVLLNNLSCLNNKEGYYFCCRTTIDVSTDNDTCRYLCCHITEEDLLTVTCELPQYSEHPSSYVNTESANEKNQPDYSNTMYTYYEPQTYGYSTATMSAGKASSYYGIPSTEILPNKYGNSGTGKPNSYNEAPSFASTSTGQKANEEQQMTNNNKPLTVQNYSNGHYTSSIPSTTQIVSTYPKAPTPKSQNTPQPSVPNNAPNPSKIGPQPSTPVTFPVQPTIGPSPSKIGPQPSNPVTSPVTSPVQPTKGPSPSKIGPHPSNPVTSPVTSPIQPTIGPSPSKIGPQPSNPVTSPVTSPVQPTIGPSSSKIGPQPSNPETSPVTSPIQPTIGPSPSQIGPQPSTPVTSPVTSPVQPTIGPSPSQIGPQASSPVSSSVIVSRPSPSKIGPSPSNPVTSPVSCPLLPVIVSSSIYR
ncbi:laminin-like protein [Galdieria sulphuraria]|uniref:Laminin-like protein n=1 Tax=Galdieria sulphuraria TaxID=130081 RepID=M2XDN8_GALSU|nr:laminin-like protein [Galdieria sulphuraria]EME28112.1 laminin-like protein [Galdieria sulphuraria]|eukprot:XP_005704632.1 laminin-like protein [Galdieria sulphuraria]